MDWRVAAHCLNERLWMMTFPILQCLESEVWTASEVAVFLAKHLWNQSLMKPPQARKKAKNQEKLKGWLHWKISTQSNKLINETLSVFLIQEWGSDFLSQQQILDSPTIRIKKNVIPRVMSNPSMRILMFSIEMRFGNVGVQDGTQHSSNQDDVAFLGSGIPTTKRIKIRKKKLAHLSHERNPYDFPFCWLVKKKGSL